MISENQNNATFTYYYNGSDHVYSGTGQGVVQGSRLNQLVLTQSIPCEGSFAGSADIVGNGSRLIGSYSGSDCSYEWDVIFDVSRN